MLYGRNLFPGERYRSCQRYRQEGSVSDGTEGGGAMGGSKGESDHRTLYCTGKQLFRNLSDV